MRNVRVILVALGSIGAGALPSSAATGVDLQPVATGLSYVTSITNAGDGSGRLFVATQYGRIMIVDSAGVRPTPFIDIHDLVSFTTEQGLLGLAFHKGYPANPYFYVDYTDPNGTIVVARYSPSANDPNVADPASRFVVMTIPHDGPYHNGGQLQFGPDGYLYIGVGDDDQQGDRANRAQSLGAYDGKVLRIDVDHGSPYAIPDTNPFRFTPGAIHEIWDYGLRNPWRFSFDRATGDLLIGDVGHYTNEEIDFEPAHDPGGRNYGWRIMEGNDCFDLASQDAFPDGCSAAGLTPPVMSYPHEDAYCAAVTGGYRYRGVATPGLGGAYFFADFCLGRMWAGLRDASGSWGFAPVRDTSSYLSTFGEDEAGEIYVAAYGSLETMYKIIGGSPALSIGDARIKEGDSGTTDAVFKVILLPPSQTEVRVDYATADGSAGPRYDYGQLDGPANAGADYVAASGTLTFAPGSTSASIVVPVLGDVQYEPAELFTVALSNPVGASIVTGGGSGVGTIVDDDAGLSVQGTSGYEGDSGTTDFTFTVTRNGNLQKAVTVDFATADGSAIAGEDYAPTAGTLTLPAGVTTARVSVPVVGDILVEPNETFTVVLSNPVNASIVAGTGTGTIINDDRGPEVSIDDVAVVEGDSGTTDATYTVSLSRTSPQTVVVSYQTYSGSALGSPSRGTDYVDTSGSLTFAPGDASHQFHVPILGDTLDEEDEVYYVDLTAQNARLVRPEATGTIIDDDPPPTLSLGDASVVEGDAGTQTLLFPVTSSGASGRYMSAPFVTSPATATEGLAPPAVPASGPFLVQSPGSGGASSVVVPNYTRPLRRVTVTLHLHRADAGTLDAPLLSSLDLLLVAPTGQSAILMSDVAGDFGDPDATIVFDERGAPLTPEPLSSGTYRPTNYDPVEDVDTFPSPAPPGPYGADLSVFAGMNPTGAWTLYAVGDQKPSDPWFCLVSWTLNFETDVDYVATSGTVTFVPGQITAGISMPVLGDHLVEGDETLSLDLGPPTNATLGQSHAVGTIMNDDLPTLVASDVQVAQQSTATSVSFAVTLDQPGRQTATVDYATSDGSAVAGVDYTPATGSLTFDPGTTTQTVAVAVAPGTTPGLDKAFFLSLSNPINAQLSKAQGLGTIMPPPPSISIDDVSVTEGDEGLTPATFTVTLSGPSSRLVTVQYSTTDGTAGAAGHDYVTTAGVLSFTPGTTTLPIAVPVAGDVVHESDEAFAVGLAVPVNASIARAQGIGTITNDDAVEQFYFGAADYSVASSASFATITVKRLGGAEAGATVGFVTVDGTATAGQDYEPAAGTLTFGENRMAAAFKVPIVRNAVLHARKTILLRLTDPAGPSGDSGLGFPDTAVLTIVDSSSPGTIQVSPAIYKVGEGAGAVTLTVRKTGVSPGPVTVDYATSDGSATAGSDYTSVSGTLTFPPGRGAIQTITVPIQQDVAGEGTETFAVTLLSSMGGPTLGAHSRATVTILDDDPVVEFASTQFAVKESQRIATITVTRSGDTTSTVAVAYSTIDGTARSAYGGGDYQAVSGTLTFGRRVTSRTFQVPILEDPLDEGTETLQLALTNFVNLSRPGAGGVGARSQATLAIVDDEATAEFSSQTYSASESAKSVAVGLRRTGTLSHSNVVFYMVTGGSAVPDHGSGGDYALPAGGFLTFPAGKAVTSLVIPLEPDSAADGPRTIELRLNQTDIDLPVGTPSNATVTIRDDDHAGVVGFGEGSYSVYESAGAAFITVARNGTAGPATVHYTTMPGATLPAAPGDYDAIAGTLTFAPGEKAKSLRVPVHGNGTPDSGAVSLGLTLDSPAGGLSLGPVATTTLWILRE